jgi:carbonic anhydrase
MNATNNALADCGMIHYHDSDIKKALLEVSPDAKDLIEVLQYGEISSG